MKPLNPRTLVDVFYLSRLLKHLLVYLEESPMQVSLPTISYHLQIPVAIFRRMANLHQQTEDAPNIQPEDFHTVFSLLLLQYPTLRIWEQEDKSVFIEM